MKDIITNAKRLYRLKLNQTLPDYKCYLFDPLHNSPAKLTAIYGCRGIGKTTLLMQLLQASPLPKESTLYISCDHPMLQDVSLFDFVEAFSQLGGALICIDEVQEAKDFEQALKSIYDFLDIKVYFTGSSAIQLVNPDLSRRYFMHHLAPLSFREMLEITQQVALPVYPLDALFEHHEQIAHEVIDRLADKKILKHFQQFLSVGAYPFYFEDPSKYVDRINETINLVLHQDLAKIFQIQPDKIDNLKKLLLTLCVTKPLELSMDKLASTVGITKATLYKYIRYLDDAELIRHITHEGKRFAAMRKSDKLYLAHPNLFEALCLNQNLGTLRETFFVSALLSSYRLHYVDQGDFLVNETYQVEIGGKNKGFEQLNGIENSYVVSDDIEVGFERCIPLWLFGFLR
ncbi:MAG: AAA family ATPase [Thiomicrospira sp.]|jgi:predicted AAA+ superfamily ATPase|nr:AAA family ATPase [Thiomicrospira sp.]